MRITFVTEYFPNIDGSRVTGGVETRVYHVATRLAKNHDVTVIASWQGDQQRDEVAEGLRVLRVGRLHPYSNEGNIGSRLAFARASYGCLKRLRPQDVIDAQCFIAYLPAYYGACRQRATAVATYHELWLGSWIRNKGLMTGVLGSVWERLALRCRWAKLIAVSGATARALVRRGIPQSRITIIPNGFSRDEIARTPIVHREPFSLCAVTRLIGTKRVDVLLRAIATIRERSPDLYGQLHCRVVGDGSAKEDLVALARSLGIADKVAFLGRLPQKGDVLRVIKSSSLLVHPSEVEGFGIVLVEASACGTPFVASDIEPFREVSERLGGGRLFKPGDCNALAATIIDHFKYRHVHPGDASQYDWDVIVADLESIYESVQE